MRIRLLFSFVAVASLCLLCAGSAAAQSNRTWVSALGDDANPCSRTAPCKTFSGAQSKTATGGEISVLDPGGYGTIVITKALTIDGGAGSGWGSVLSSGTNGITVNAPSSAVVTLRNLSINGTRQTQSPGLSGIRFIAGASLHIENCVIYGLNNNGIEINLGGAGNVSVKDTTIEEVGGNGISATTSNGTVGVTLERVQISKTNVAVAANGNSVVTVRDSVFAFSTTGLAAATNAQANLENNLFASNSTGVSIGVGTNGRLSNNTFANNLTGVSNNGTGLSSGTNRFLGNVTDRSGPAFGAEGVQ